MVVLTSDRNPAMLGQWEDQMIDQVGMFDRHVRKSVNLPDVANREDFIFCQRLVNEALLELDHHGTGPVHINIPMRNYNRSFTCKTLPDVTRIERLDIFSDPEAWKSKLERLKNCRRILIVCGQNAGHSAELERALSEFFAKFNCAVAVEAMSNIECDGSINTSVCMDNRYIVPHQFSRFLPDIVISFGNNVMQGLKEQLRIFSGKFEHWSIQEDGRVVDMYKSLTTIFECPPPHFFKRCNELIDSRNDKSYYDLLKEFYQKVVIPDFTYSNIYAIKRVVENIPEKSILHLSINNSIRISNFFKLAPQVTTYANIGTHGIDGCLSSFLGQASATDRPAFLIIGDLSLFYDMNALRLRHIGPNVHILMLNNHGGEEFYYNKIWVNESSDRHTSARHTTKAEGWVNECGFTYLKASDKAEFDENLPRFMSEDNSRPVFFEVFTEMKTDAEEIHKFYDLSRPKDLKSEILRQGKEFAKSVIGQQKAQKIIDLLK